MLDTLVIVPGAKLEIIHIRVTGKEKSAIERGAKKMGLSVSEMLRQAARQKMIEMGLLAQRRLAVPDA